MTKSPEPTNWIDPSPTANELSNETPYYIGHYRIMGAIGVGSSAAVYRGLDEASGSEVAIKILADNYSLVTEIRQRFTEEATLLMSIRSPAVAQVYGQGETDGGQPYIVLELADRGTLGDRVEQRRQTGHTVSDADLRAVGTHLATALAALHRADIVHRDVSPGNVLISAGAGAATEGSGSNNLLSPGERYLLADLGFAKNLRQASGLTAGGGTKGFAAPEQQREVTVVDHRADVFGATSVIAWLAEGTELVEPLGPFLRIGLAETPADRHQTMDDWLSDLTRHLDRRPAALFSRQSQDPANSSQLPSVADHSRRRVPVLALAAIGLGAIAAAVALVFANSFDTDGNTDTDAASSTTSSTTSTTVPTADSTATASTSPSAPATSTTPTSTTPTSTTTASTSSASVTSINTSVITTATSTVITASTSTTAPTPTTNTTTSTTTNTTVSTTTVSTTRPPSTSPPTTSETTTTDPLFRLSPRAYIVSPVAEAEITGDLRIDGTGEYSEGIIGVLLTVRRADDDFAWDPETGSFVSQWQRFAVPVTPLGANDVAWTFTLGKRFLEPGRYVLRVWATGNGANDPVSDRLEIVVPEAS